MQTDVGRDMNSLLLRNRTEGILIAGTSARERVHKILWIAYVTTGEEMVELMQHKYGKAERIW
jgi:hypothetical protein